MATTVGKFHKVTHCLFDLDGLMLDTEKLYTEATQSILDEFGKVYTFEVKSRLMGMHSHEVAEAIVKIYNLPLTVDEYSKRQKKACDRLMGNAQLMPGVEDLVRHLYAFKIPLALATSSSASMVEKKIVNHRDLFKLFHHHVCGSSDPEVIHGKPHPDIFLIAASRFPKSPKPSNCLVFEDAPNGVAAAKAAGMQVVMVPDKRLPPELRIGATQVLKSMRDFIPHLYGLPDYRGD